MCREAGSFGDNLGSDVREGTPTKLETGRKGTPVSSGNATLDLYYGPNHKLWLGPNTSNAMGVEQVRCELGK